MKYNTAIATLVLLCPVWATLADEKTDPEPKTVEVKAQDLTLVVPESWKQQQPSNRLRLTQFLVPANTAGVDDSEVVVFPPLLGSIEQNIQRWIDQFASDGRQFKAVQGEAPQGKYILVELTGTYNKPDGPPVLGKTVPTPGYSMIGVILTAEKGNYFLKLVGPAESVKTELAAFRKCFGGDTANEKKYDF